MFEINLYSQKQEFHRYSTDDFALLDIGIGNYNRSSLAQFLNLKIDPVSMNPVETSRPVNPDVKEFFSDDSNTGIFNKLFGDGSESVMKIIAYDANEKKYKMKTGLAEITKIDQNVYKDHDQPATTIKQFLKEWHGVQLGTETNARKINGYKLIAQRIQNSASGCITFDANLTILKQARKSLIRLYILDTKHTDSSKTIGFFGSPIFTAPPQTSYFMRYSRENTSNAPVGSYVAMSADSNSPKDMVAGKAKMVWDPTTCTWEFGTQQIIARLITNIDATNIPELTGDQLRSLSRDETYEVTPEENPIIGKIQKGSAIPISMENGNENLFGPDFRGGCNNSTEKSIIEVFNLSPRSYKEGTLVLCSYINGRWVISNGEGNLTESKKLLTFGRFEFQQYIIPENLYFAVPNSIEKFLPDKWASKIRSSYYMALSEGGSEQLKLNIVASSMVQEEENPLLYLINGYKNFNNSSSQSFNDNKLIDGQDCMFGGSSSTYFKNYHSNSDSPVVQFNYYPYSEKEFRLEVPKNALVNSSRSLSLDLPGVKNGPGDPIDKFDIPLFWGMLFPDGYKSEQCKKFFADPIVGPILKNNPIYKNDPNLKELSVASCISLPYIDDEKKFLLYAKNIASIRAPAIGFNRPPQDLVRKTGGSFRNLGVQTSQGQQEFDYLFGVNFLSARLSMQVGVGYSKQFDRQLMSTILGASEVSIYGLEPVNPRRLQFSPMSIDFLYSQSTLNNPNFTVLKSYIEFLNTPLPHNLKLLANTYWSAAQYSPTGSFQDSQIFPNNTHNFKGLAFGEAFGPNPINAATIHRHSPPLGVVNGGLIIPPPPTAGGYPRSPVIPVLTCRSSIRTNSRALTFKTFGYFGNPQKTTVTGPAGIDGQVTVIPIGGGLAWQEPNTPISINQTPQWGDRNRTDDIDSLGTTALHVRIFEAWPEYLTIYLGPIYTPLHFNPSGPEWDYEASINENTGLIDIKDKETTDEPKRKIEYVSEVDFKEPTQFFTGPFYNYQKTALNIQAVTNKQGEPIPNLLAPFDDWKYNTTRRGKLLTNGGFAYFKKVLCVYDVNFKPDQNGQQVGRGSGYKTGDQFLLPDGTKFTITASSQESGGKITGIGPIEFNFDPTNELRLVKNPSAYAGMNSTNITAQYLGTTGTGASFDYEIGVGTMVGHDAAPKEVTPITRITKSSNSGTNYVDGEYTTTVELQNTNKKDFDIFYFFHNDPTSYALGVEVFNNNNAQYVISEVNPA